MYITATPPATSWLTRSKSRCTAPRSSAAVGSSSSRQRAPVARARAISTICSCSTVSFSHSVVALMSKPHSPMIASVRSRMVRQLTRPPRAVRQLPRKTFSATVSCGTTMECWKTVAIRPCQASTAPAGGAGSPSKSTCPVSGASSPLSTETMVDLPAPLRPTRPRQRPASRLRSTPRRAWVLPKCLSIPTAWTAGT